MIASETGAHAFCAALVDRAAVERLEFFARRLAEENGRQNLVSEASLKYIWRRHIADSLQLLAYVPRETSPWLDLGTGAGPPGLIVAIARPDIAMNLIESRKRRAEWLRAVSEELALVHCRVIDRRLEDVEPLSARVISARAFAPLPRLLRLSARFSTPRTVWLLPKGRSAAQELQSQPISVRRMFHVKPSLTDQDAGILIGQGRPIVE